MSAQKKETLSFKAETKQLLDLMVHSLYSNKEIFLRELISNASDAADKLRFESLSDKALLEQDPDLKIWVEFDKESKTVTVRDNGIGMNHDEVIENLGTIAKSGTREFLDTLSGDQAKDAQMIGKFGVGFYSSFIVANKVMVNTRRAGDDAKKGVSWESNGEGEYTIEAIEKAERGTEIILHLREDELDFLDDWRLKSIIHKYSDHISIPIVMKKEVEENVDEEKSEKGDDSSKEKITQIIEETVNRATALWQLPKAEIKEEEYHELYKHISHDFEDPMLWTHNKVEGKQEYTLLLYIPKRPPFDLFQREHKQGLKLYVKRVFIMDDAEQFLPNYLRFVKGIVDSADLPLNISREILQNNRLIDSIRSSISKRVLDMLEKLQRDDATQYDEFWTAFGKVLKEGPAEDFKNRDRISKLLRFSSTQTDSETQNVSLEDYMARMKSGQDKIYYVTAESFNAAKNSPHLEIFRKRDIEVILLSDPIDEWFVGHMTEFEGKKFVSVARGDLDLGELDSESGKQDKEKTEGEFKDFLEQAKKSLGEKVKEVRITFRLTDSPACVVAGDQDLNLQMQRMLKAAGQEVPEMQPIFEINPEHPLVKRLQAEEDNARFGDWMAILFDQAVLAEGGHLKEPAVYVQRMNKMMLELMGE